MQLPTMSRLLHNHRLKHLRLREQHPTSPQIPRPRIPTLTLRPKQTSKQKINPQNITKNRIMLPRRNQYTPRIRTRRINTKRQCSSFTYCYGPAIGEVVGEKGGVVRCGGGVEEGAEAGERGDC